MVFAPSVAQANLLTDILSPRAQAGGEIITDTNTPPNSQTLAVLAVSAASPVLDKKSSKSEEKSSKEEKVDENTSVNVSKEALLPTITPAISDEDTIYSDSEYNLDIYVVRRGDTVPLIAEMFDITADTIYSANDLSKGAKVKEGDVLIILPFSGVEHTVKKGETLKGLANKYKVPVEDIAGYNDLSGSKISVGQKLMIPGGAIQEEAKKPVKKPTNTASSGRLPIYDSTPATNADGYYIKPIPCRLTQGRHDRYAVDMGCRVVGTPILAAASGEVIFSKAGAWNGGYGGLVIIKHPNGTLTYYAHQSKIIVDKGDHVNQGEVIGYVGNTGRSTGPHLHFEVRGAKNPGFDNSWKPWD